MQKTSFLQGSFLHFPVRYIPKLEVFCIFCSLSKEFSTKNSARDSHNVDISTANYSPLYIIYLFLENFQNCPKFWGKLDFELTMFTIRLKIRAIEQIRAFVKVDGTLRKCDTKNVMKRRPRPRRNWKKWREQKKLTRLIRLLIIFTPRFNFN